MNLQALNTIRGSFGQAVEAYSLSKTPENQQALQDAIVDLAFAWGSYYQDGNFENLSEAFADVGIEIEQSLVDETLYLLRFGVNAFTRVTQEGFVRTTEDDIRREIERGV